ncbi:hypothetical protein Ndes2526B_g09280 [Nannochloris sp. 'desiccata']|nr:hypothetical protein KSW81_003690 [Chlorella desiccata (nom. nud.)]KAH7615965.1 hypothetical protein NADE_000802 [Chlorella desiccata (nom. nud.)]
MKRMKNVTSAEDLLQLLRSGRESQDAPSLLEPSSCPFEPALTQAKGLPLTEAALETLDNSRTRMLDAALHLLEQPISLLRPTMPTTVPQSLSLPGELLQSQIPLASLQATELLGSGFAPVSDWDRGQGPVNSAGDEQTGSFSEDTHQDILRAGGNDASSRGAAVRPAQIISAGKMMQRQQQQQQTTGRPQRQTAKRALEKFGGSTHQSVADEDEDFNEDDISDTEDVSDAYGRRMHRSSSGAQSFQRTTSSCLDGLGGHGGGGGRGNNKQPGKHLKGKSYDALVDPTLPPEEVRRIRRILSNRESARRSRKRKATQISTLEDELMEVRMAATEVESELIEALKNARALEKDKSKLLAEVDMLRKKLAAFEAAASSPSPSPQAAAVAAVNTTTLSIPTSSGAVPAPSAVPITVPVNVPVSAPPQKQQKPPQILQRQLSLPLPLKVNLPAATAGSLTAPPVMPLPLPVASIPIASTAAADASPLVDPRSANKNAAGGTHTRRASPPNAHHTSARSHHFQSPLRQGGSQVSHRVRFRPVPPPSFFPDAPFVGNIYHEDINQGLLL